MGGGDGKVDTNTYPVADAVSDGRWIGAPRGDDRWAFAFNAMEGLEAEGAKRRRQDRRDGSGVLPTKFGTRAPTIASGSPERSPQWARRRSSTPSGAGICRPHIGDEGGGHPSE